MVAGIDFSHFQWLNEPARFSLEKGVLSLATDPETDFWQRTYYGFRHDNAHAFILPVGDEKFSFTVKATWQPKALYDQCGVVLYQDADNWFKASVEYDSEARARLGSVVTNLGFSDWATTDVDAKLNSMVYRLSRRGQDFLIENAIDGKDFKQMRIFHVHQTVVQARIGVYACSPMKSSMQVVFSGFRLAECGWE